MSIEIRAFCLPCRLCAMGRVTEHSTWAQHTCRLSKRHFPRENSTYHPHFMNHLYDRLLWLGAYRSLNESLLHFLSWTFYKLSAAAPQRTDCCRHCARRVAATTEPAVTLCAPQRGVDFRSRRPITQPWLMLIASESWAAPLSRAACSKNLQQVSAVCAEAVQCRFWRWYAWRSEA